MTSPGEPATTIPTDPTAARDELWHQVCDLEELIDRLVGAAAATEALVGTVLGRVTPAERDPDEAGLAYASDAAYATAHELRRIYHQRLHPLAVAAKLQVRRGCEHG